MRNPLDNKDEAPRWVVEYCTRDWPDRTNMPTAGVFSDHDDALDFVADALSRGKITRRPVRVH